MSSRGTDPAEAPVLLYLITNEISSGFLRGQLAFLVERGYKVVVATALDSASGSSSFDEGVETVRIPFEREPSLLRDLKALWVTGRTIRKIRPALVNSSTPKAGLIGTLAAFLCRVPERVYVVRGLRFETATGVGRLVLKATERVATALATRVIFNSRSSLEVAEAQRVVRVGAGLVLGAGSGNGLNTSRFEQLPSRTQARSELGFGVDDEVVGFVGRLTMDKGADDLVKVFQRLVVSRPRLRLLLVGTFETGDAVGRAIQNVVEDDPRIIHIAWTDHPGIAYRAMDILAFPSFREGLPNVPLEAQLCARPVVGYSATGTVDAVVSGKTGLLVPTGDVIAFQDALVELLDDPDRAIVLGEQGSLWVRETFSQTRVWNALATHYDEWLCRT